jgi:hypothetical protein
MYQPADHDPHANDHHHDQRRHDEQLNDEASRWWFDRRKLVVAASWWGGIWLVGAEGWGLVGSRGVGHGKLQWVMGAFSFPHEQGARQPAVN